MLVKLLIAVMILAGAFYVLAARLERRLMYFPATQRISPVDVGLSEFEEHVLTTGDGEQVIAWYAKAPPGAPTILYFHGNAGSLATRSERLQSFVQSGRGMLIMTYRGYGGSTGSPSERANVADAKMAYDKLVAWGVSPEDIIVYGESLGTGIGVQVAAEKTVAGVVLDAPYTSIVEVAGLCFPYLPTGFMMRDRYETMRYIGHVTAPLLVIHGEQDDIIPVAMGRTVAAAAGGPARIKTFEHAGHTDHYVYGSFEAVSAWIDELRAGKIDNKAAQLAPPQTQKVAR